MRSQHIAWGFVVVAVASACSGETAVPTPPEPEAMVVVPTALAFGDVELGARRTQRLTVTRGGVPASDFSARWAMGSGGPFDERVEPGAIEVTYRPSALGASSLTLVLSELGASATVEVPVSGSGVAPELPTLTVSSTSISFGRVEPSQTATRALWVMNPSSAPIRAQVELGDRVRRCDERSDAPFCVATRVPVTIEAGGAVELELRFVPTATAATERAVLRLWSCAECAPLEIGLVGDVAATRLSCSPDRVELRGPGGVTVTQTIVCGYPPGSARTIQRWRTVRNIVEVVPLQSALAPGQPVSLIASVRVHYDFGVGDDHLIVTDDHPDPALREVRIPIHFELGGPRIGLGTLTGTPRMYLTRTSIAGSSRQPLAIINAGLGPLNVTGAEVTTGTTAFRIVGPTRMVVPQGERRHLLMELRPIAETNVRGTVEVRSDDPEAPVVQLGLDSVLSVSAQCALDLGGLAHLDFGEVERGRTLRRTIAARNLGPTGCREAWPRIMTAGTEVSIPVSIIPRLLSVVPAGGVEFLEVDFDPEVLAAVRAQLEINTYDPAQPFLEIPVSGLGIDAAPTIVPRSVDFGQIGPACAAVEQSVTFHNSTSSSIRIDAVELDGATDVFEVRGAPVGVTLAPGSKTTFEVRVRVSALTSGRAAAVRITSGERRWMVDVRAEPNAHPSVAYEGLGMPRATDILWVIPASSPRRATFAAIAADFTDLIVSAGDPRTDVQVAAVFADLDGASAGHLLPLGGAEIIDVLSLPTPGVALQRVLATPAPGAAVDASLWAVEQALSWRNVQGPNAGFFRPTAALSVIVVSDGDDTSAVSTDVWAGFFDNLRWRRSPLQRYGGMPPKPLSGAYPVTFSAIAGPVGGCTGNDLTAVAAPRYLDLVRRTGGAFHSICSPSLPAADSHFVATVLGNRQRFPLPRSTDPRTIAELGPSVGVSSVDPVPPALVFRSIVPGASVQIGYDHACAP